MTNKMKYMVVYEKGPSSYGAYVPDLPGCIAAGETMEEVRHLIQEGMAIYLEELWRKGERIPPASTQVEFIEIQPTLAKAS